MTNSITWGNISFYVNNTFIENMTFIEGNANITYNVNISGLVPVTGTYTGNGVYLINILQGELDLILDDELTIIKSVNATNVTNRDTVSYTINFTNTGINNATNVIVIDILDSRLVFINNYSGVSYDSNTGTLNWIIFNLNSGENVSLIFTVKINGTGFIYNIVNVTSNEVNNISNEVTINVSGISENNTNSTKETNDTNKPKNPNENNAKKSDKFIKKIL